MRQSHLILPDDGKFLVVANHRFAFDPFIMLAALSFKDFRRIVPIKFFTKNFFLKIPVLNIFLMSFGCFPAKRIDGKGGLHRAQELSDAGYSLFIFPQGKVQKTEERGELKVGAAYLAKRRTFTILPVSIDRRRGVVWRTPRTFTPSPGEDLQNDSKEIFGYIEGV